LQAETDSSSAVALGITILSIAMVLSACLGLLQEVTYRKYGKAWREGLFYTVSEIGSTGRCQDDITVHMKVKVLTFDYLSSAWTIPSNLFILLQRYLDSTSDL
jgi:hypothetical protein